MRQITGEICSLDDLDELAEAFSLRNPLQFKEQHFSTQHSRPSLLHPLQPEVPIGLASRRHRIRHDLHTVAGFEEIKGRLVDTNVGFDPTENDGPSLQRAEPVHERRFPHTTESRLGNRRLRRQVLSE